MNQDTRVSRESREQVVADLFDEVRLSQNMSDAFDEAVSTLMNINRTDLRCLDIIERHRGLTAGQLADESGLTTGAVTVVLDRLERIGYVRRVRDTADRRRVIVELTPKSRRLTARFYGPLGRIAQEVASRYTTSELRVIRDFLRKGRELSAEHKAALRTRAARDQGVTQTRGRRGRRVRGTARA